MSKDLRRDLAAGLAAALATLAPAGAARAATARAAAPASHAPVAHLISHSREAVPFVADDYAGALAAARAKKVPIFVEAWAPW
jgi:hypothetical protein